MVLFDTITGKMATGFYNLPGKTVYYGTDGKMLYKEQKIGNYYYYFDAVTGAMVKNTTINGHYYDNTGKRVEKQQESKPSDCKYIYHKCDADGTVL